MRTIEQICEDLTGINAMVFMRGTNEEFQTFFEENNIEWVRELLKRYNGNWEAVPSPEDLIESFVPLLLLLVLLLILIGFLLVWRLLLR